MDFGDFNYDDMDGDFYEGEETLFDSYEEPYATVDVDRECHYREYETYTPDEISAMFLSILEEDEKNTNMYKKMAEGADDVWSLEEEDF